MLKVIIIIITILIIIISIITIIVAVNITIIIIIEENLQIVELSAILHDYADYKYRYTSNICKCNL